MAIRCAPSLTAPPGAILSVPSSVVVSVASTNADPPVVRVVLVVGSITIWPLSSSAPCTTFSRPCVRVTPRRTKFACEPLLKRRSAPSPLPATVSSPTMYCEAGARCWATPRKRLPAPIEISSDATSISSAELRGASPAVFTSRVLALTWIMVPSAVSSRRPPISTLSAPVACSALGDTRTAPGAAPAVSLNRIRSAATSSWPPRADTECPIDTVPSSTSDEPAVMASSPASVGSRAPVGADPVGAKNLLAKLSVNWDCVRATAPGATWKPDHRASRLLPSDWTR